MKEGIDSYGYHWRDSMSWYILTLICYLKSTDRWVCIEVSVFFFMFELVSANSQLSLRPSLH
jgi:hypothetical protein